jgi:ethanolamine transporter EutH
MIVGKLVAGVLSVVLAIFISKRTLKEEKVDGEAQISDKNP